MPLPVPADGITAKIHDNLIVHLTADTELAPYINLPILAYPVDGFPATHPERVMSLWYLDADDGYADNQSHKGEHVFTTRIKIKEAGASYAEIAVAHRVAENLKDILTDALWRCRRDDCSAPPALWYKMLFASPSAKVSRNKEEAAQVLEMGFKVFTITQNRGL